MLREPLVIAVAQPLCVPYDVAVNAVTHAATVRSAGARVVVFPELSLTGYELDAPAITAEDPRLTPIVEACAEAGSLALVGAPVQGEAGRSHIAMVAIEGTGATVAYHKMWLSTTESIMVTNPGDGWMSCQRLWPPNLQLIRITTGAGGVPGRLTAGIAARLARCPQPLRRPD